MPALRINLLLLGLSLAVLASNAPATEATTTNTFELTTGRERLLGREPFTRAYLTCGNKKFTFVVPDGYRLDATKPDELVLISQDFASFITLRVADFIKPKALSAESCREAVLARYADGRIAQEFSQAAGGDSGPTFDVQGKTLAGLRRDSRVAFIPNGEQVLEFSLVASPEKFGSSAVDLQTLMLTFRTSDTHGKTNVAVLSDHI